MCGRRSQLKITWKPSCHIWDRCRIFPEIDGESLGNILKWQFGPWSRFNPKAAGVRYSVFPEVTYNVWSVTLNLTIQYHPRNSRSTDTCYLKIQSPYVNSSISAMLNSGTVQSQSRGSFGMGSHSWRYVPRWNTLWTLLANARCPSMLAKRGWMRCMEMLPLKRGRDVVRSFNCTPLLLSICVLLTHLFYF